MKDGARAAGAARDHPAVALRVKAPACGLSAPVADVLAIQVRNLLHGKAVTHDAVAHTELHGGGDVGRPGLLELIQELPYYLGFLRREALLGAEQVSDQVVDQNGTVFQPVPSFGAERGDKVVIFIEVDLVCIGEGVDRRDIPRGIAPMSREEPSSSTGASP